MKGENNQFERETFTAELFYSITPSDTADLPVKPRAIMVGGAGNLVARNVRGNDITIAVVAGQIVPIKATRVLSTGTTATGLTALV